MRDPALRRQVHEIDSAVAPPFRFIDDLPFETADGEVRIGHGVDVPHGSRGILRGHFVADEREGVTIRPVPVLRRR